jgi:hypothetical protein
MAPKLYLHGRHSTAEHAPDAATDMVPATPSEYTWAYQSGGEGMHGKNLQSRITRLQELIMRLSQEDLSWKDDIYPLHHMERNAYLSAIHKAIGALSEARIVLSQATHRLGDPK